MSRLAEGRGSVRHGIRRRNCQATCTGRGQAERQYRRRQHHVSAPCCGADLDRVSRLSQRHFSFSTGVSVRRVSVTGAGAGAADAVRDRLGHRLRLDAGAHDLLFDDLSRGVQTLLWPAVPDDAHRKTG